MNRNRSSEQTRAQANLLAVAVAALALTAAAGLGLFIADGALQGADRASDERAMAVSLSDRLVAADGPVAERPNVVNETALSALDGDALATRYPLIADADVRIRVDDRVVVERGDPTGGTTVRRIVTVREEERRTITPSLSTDGDRGVTLPRRTDRVRIRIDPPSNTTVRTVRVDGRVVRHDPDGLNGSYAIDVSRLETVRLSVDGDGALPRGAVTVTYFPATTRKATLAVTVDA